MKQLKRAIELPGQRVSVKTQTSDLEQRFKFYYEHKKTINSRKYNELIDISHQLFLITFELRL